MNQIAFYLSLDRDLVYTFSHCWEWCEHHQATHNCFTTGFAKRTGVEWDFTIRNRDIEDEET
jgi:hypothetical protein